MSGGVEQQRSAADASRYVRVARAELKRWVATGEVGVPEAARSVAAHGMPLADLLTAQPRWGLVRARRALHKIRASEWTLAGDLTDRQRAALEEVLAG